MMQVNALRSSIKPVTAALLALAIGLAPIAAGPDDAAARERPFRLVIDPGHGGQNMGAVGPYGVHEKYVTLIIANKVAELFKGNPDVVVFFTRKDDSYVSLRDRAEMGNALDADIFLSIHCNAATNPSASGIETFFVGPGSDESTTELAGRENGNEASPDGGLPDQSLSLLLADMAFNGVVNESALLAETVQNSLMSAFLGARNRQVRQAPFTVLEAAEMPAVVIETGFITHAVEGRQLLMSDYQDRIAAAIHGAVIEYMRILEEKPAFARQYEIE